MPKNIDPTPPTVVDDADLNASNTETVDSNLPVVGNSSDGQTPLQQARRDDIIAIETPKEKIPTRYVVERHASFELVGQTVTFRENQIVSDARELEIARAFNVPLRELALII